MKISYNRIDRVSDLIKREVSEILLFEAKDPRISQITITHAEVTKDLKQAKIFFSTLKKGKDLERALQGLQGAAGFVQKKLGERLYIRFIPHLTFLFDPTLEYGAHMDHILKELHEKEDM